LSPGDDILSSLAPEVIGGFDRDLRRFLLLHDAAFAAASANVDGGWSGRCGGEGVAA
jgi:hypothetical protein